MLKFARVVHFDEGDKRAFDRVAPAGDWAVSGSFSFADWDGSDDERLTNAFERGWLGIGSFGRASAAMVSEITPIQLGGVRQQLASYLMSVHRAANRETALALADQEIAFVQDICAALDEHMVLLIRRELTEDGVREACRAVRPKAAAVH